ncbi:MAG: hypothetical protein M5R38_12810 [Candidatus Methylomirabilis sp.]|nr:hypothetical protein [Candidatus Methylomirabilis sp.]
MHEPLLTAVGKELSVRSAKAAATGEGVLDESTFNTIEVDRLFDAVNHASTITGQATLYRSLAHPLNSIETIRAKQEALKELDSNADLRARVEALVEHAANHEAEFYRLMFGNFVGTFGDPKGKMDTGGYGHKTYRQGTELMLGLVKGAHSLPTPESSYLRARLDTLKAFGSTRSHALMKGPAYLTERAIKTRAEKVAADPSHQIPTNPLQATIDRPARDSIRPFPTLCPYCSRDISSSDAGRPSVPAPLVHAVWTDCWRF